MQEDALNKPLGGQVTPCSQKHLLSLLSTLSKTSKGTLYLKVPMLNFLKHVKIATLTYVQALYHPTYEFPQQIVQESYDKFEE